MTINIVCQEKCGRIETYTLVLTERQSDLAGKEVTLYTTCNDCLVANGGMHYPAYNPLNVKGDPVSSSDYEWQIGPILGPQELLPPGSEPRKAPNYATAIRAVRK